MTSDHWQLVEDLFHQALALTPSDREQFLAAQAKQSPELTAEIQALLEYHDQSIELENTSSNEQLQQAIVDATNLLNGSLPEHLRDVTQVQDGSGEQTQSDSLTLNSKEARLQAENILASMSERYEFRDLIGVGGGGSVAKVWDKSLHRTVALKILHANKQSDFQEQNSDEIPGDQQRLLAESRSLAGIQSDHIVQIFEVGEVEGNCFILMEYVDGPSLKQFLADTPQLSSRLAAELASQIASGLASAHAQGFIHRDIKPSNILVAHGPDSGYRIKIIDFGLAKPVNLRADSQEEHRIEGTPAYMSPELFEGKHAAQKQSDVYALGVTLYQLLTGVAPFRGALHMLLKQKHRPVAPPRSLDDRIPIDLESVCLKAMAESARERYADAQEFQQDLIRFLDGKPTLARPLTWWQVSLRWTSRHKAVTVASGLLLLLLCTLAVGSSAYASMLWSKNRAIEYERKQTQAALESQILTGEPESLTLAIEQFERMALEPMNRLQLLSGKAQTTRQRLNVACAQALLGGDTQAEIVSLIPKATATSAQCRVLAQALKQKPLKALGHLNAAYSKQAEFNELTNRIRIATLASFLGDSTLLSATIDPSSAPTARTQFIHGLGSWCPNLDAAIQQATNLDSPELATAFMLGLGWIDSRSFSAPQLLMLRRSCDQLLADATCPPSLGSAARWLGKKRGWELPSPASGLPFQMISISPGTFLMGSGNPELLYQGRKQQPVEITRPYQIADREVTVGFFREVLSNSKTAEHQAILREWKPDDIISPTDLHPAQQLTWFDAIAFCNALSEQFGFTPCYRRADDIQLPGDGEQGTQTQRLPNWICDFQANGFRLPTEAEWEFAARAGTQSAYSFGNDRHYLEYYGRWSNNTRVHSEVCATLMPNPWGLFDVHGNVWEWTQDWFLEYPEELRIDPCNNVPNAIGKSYRGGGVATFSGDPLANARGSTSPNNSYFNVGFRVARTAVDN